MTGDEVQVQHRRKVNFATSDDWTKCGAMSFGDALVGRPWVYDKNRIHWTRDNAYTFFKDKKLAIIWSRNYQRKDQGQVFQRNRSKYDIFIEEMQIGLEIEIELFCNVGGMMQVQWAGLTKTLAQILGPKEGILWQFIPKQKEIFFPLEFLVGMYLFGCN